MRRCDMRWFWSGSFIVVLPATCSASRTHRGLRQNRRAFWHSVCSRGIGSLRQAAREERQEQLFPPSAPLLPPYLSSLQVGVSFFPHSQLERHSHRARRSRAPRVARVRPAIHLLVAPLASSGRRGRERRRQTSPGFAHHACEKSRDFWHG